MNKLSSQLLSKLLCHNELVDITISGISMNPTFKEGDIVTIQKSSQYSPGDILVYPYKEGTLLIHRLLHIDKRYFCKGDNAFRIEDISVDQIIGKAVLVNKQPIPEWPKWKIDLSYGIGKTFRQCHYDIVKTKETSLYKQYAALVLQKQ